MNRRAKPKTPPEPEQPRPEPEPEPEQPPPEPEPEPEQPPPEPEPEPEQPPPKEVIHLARPHGAAGSPDDAATAAACGASLAATRSTYRAAAATCPACIAAVGG